MGGRNATHSAGRGDVFHDWFPYLEGFSSSFVESVRGRYLPNSTHILEPFAGSGTTPIHLAREGVSCSYCEINPVLLHLIGAKTCALSQETSRSGIVRGLRKLAREISTIPSSAVDDPIAKSYGAAFGDSKYFRDDNFETIIALKQLERNVAKQDPVLATFFSVAVYSSLLDGSLLKRAGDVRFRTPKELLLGIPSINTLVARKIELICSDLLSCEPVHSLPTLLETNAKALSSHKAVRADGVITSPPYLNGTNYIRNTRLELWYLEHLNETTTLRTFRDAALTAGINDVTNGKKFQILPEVESTYQRVLAKAYDQRIPQMVASYFFEMKQVLVGLRKHIRRGGRICIDIGDSIYAGVHVPTHDILLNVCNSMGLKLVERVQLRERLSYNKETLTQQLLVLQK